MALLSFAAPAPARADDEPGGLVPPHVIDEVTPLYPEGASGEASVVLEIVVLEDGSTGDVVVVDAPPKAGGAPLRGIAGVDAPPKAGGAPLRGIAGGEPFVTAAIDAVRRYHFEPAHRAGLPVRSRIRIAITFSQPAPEPVPTSAAAAPTPDAGSAPPAPPPAAKVVDEVTITGNRRATSTPMEHRIGRADVRVLPGAFGDPFRAIEMLPGVVPTISGLPYYYIRGAPPSAVGYFIDDVRVPYLFHFALGPGVIQPALIDEVSLDPASFPGRYGRYAGAVVAGKTREPATELTGEGNIRLFDAGAYLESPFADGKGAAGVGGRYSYTAALFSLFVPKTTVDYRDYNARVSYQIADRWRLTAFAFGSYDYASQIDDQTGKDQVLFASEFHRLDVRLDRVGADGATTRIAMTFGLDRSRIEADRFAEDFVLGIRARHRAPVSKEVDVEIGADMELDNYTGDLPSPYAVSTDDYAQAQAFFSPRVDTATGAWALASWHPTKGFELTGTARADVFTSDGKVAVGPSPRVAMRVPFLVGGAPAAFLGAVGIAPQPPAFAVPIPAVGYSGLPGGLGYGYQKSAGAEIDLPFHFTTRAVVFHHSYFNLRDFARDTTNLDITAPQPVPRSPTQAYGLEYSISRKLSERFGAFLSYTLSRSELGSTQLTQARVSPFDRTHVLQLGGTVDIGRGWRAGARFLTYRGWPDEGTSPIPSAPPTARLPPFYRLDGRIEKRWNWRKTGYISFVIEVLNATASKEIVRRECTPTGCKDDAIGPITVPSIGVEGAL